MLITSKVSVNRTILRRFSQQARSLVPTIGRKLTDEEYSDIFRRPPPRHYDKYEAVVGLEVHAQMRSKSKLFSRASTNFSAPHNSQVDLFDIALPGTLPKLNRRCVELAILAAIGLGCELQAESHFDRKHYFYADMPAGFQITQQTHPIARQGFLEFPVFNPSLHRQAYLKKSHIKQLQIEQDSGKSIHDSENKRSLIDLNRAGCGLIEIVFEPDLCDGEEASSLIKELILLLTSLQVCDCHLEEGNLRVDANVSIRTWGHPHFGVRTEIKNLNSIRAIQKAIDYEIGRQVNLTIQNGGNVDCIVNETLSYDPILKETVQMRDKEVAQDYRFMPEPNLPPLRLATDDTAMHSPHLVNIDDMRRTIPELPCQQRDRLLKSYPELTLSQTINLLSEPGMIDYFCTIMDDRPERSVARAFNILMISFKTHLNQMKMDFADSQIPALHIGQLVDLLEEEKITSGTATDTLQLMLQGDRRDALSIIKENNWWMIKDEELIKEVIVRVLERNPKKAKMYKKRPTPWTQEPLLDEIKLFVGRKVASKQLLDLLNDIVQPKARTKKHSADSSQALSDHPSHEEEEEHEKS